MRSSYKKKFVVTLELDEEEFNTILSSLSMNTHAHITDYATRNKLSVLTSGETISLLEELKFLKNLLTNH